MVGVVWELDGTLKKLEPMYRHFPRRPRMQRYSLSPASRPQPSCVMILEFSDSYYLDIVVFSDVFTLFHVRIEFISAITGNGHQTYMLYCYIKPACIDYY